jgi:gas vesicle protein
MNNQEVSSFFTGFFIGALLGGAAALLFAPQSGEETRTQLRDKGIELKDKAEATYADAMKKLEASTEELRKKTEELSVKVDDLIAQGREEFAKVAKKGTEAAPAAEAGEQVAAEA